MKTLLKIVLLFLSYGILYAQQYSIRFYGYGYDDLDRIKIALESSPPPTSKPVNVGNNFTIEFWLKSLSNDNSQGSQVQSGPHDDWVYGHIIVDRDIFGPGDYGDYGISLAGGRIAFGVNNGSSSYTIVGTTDLRDGQWHHIAVTRSNGGSMAIYVDGALNASYSSGPSGNIAYRVGRSLSNDCNPPPCINEPYIILGAEKHDYDPPTYPSFSGWIDELRISSIVRYTSSFSPPSNEFTLDGNTVGLYHFNEGNGTDIEDDAGSSHGILVEHPNLPNWSSDSPFQALSASHYFWTYNIKDLEVEFIWPAFTDDFSTYHISITSDLRSQEIKTLELLPISYFYGTSNKKYYSVTYPLEKIKVGFYRLDYETKDGKIYVGRWAWIDPDNSDENLIIFPNPTENILHIRAESAIEDLGIYDMEGQLKIYQSYEMSGQTIYDVDVSGLRPGVYIVRMKLGTKRATLRMVKW